MRNRADMAVYGVGRDAFLACIGWLQTRHLRLVIEIRRLDAQIAELEQLRLPLP